MGGKVKPWHSKRPKKFGKDKPFSPNKRSDANKQVSPPPFGERPIRSLREPAFVSYDDWDDEPVMP